MIYKLLANPITENVNNYLSDVGIDDAFAQVFLVVGIMVTLTIFMHIVNAPYAVVILVNTLIFIMAIVFGMLPMWILLLVFMIVFAYILLVMFDISPGSIGRKER